MQILVTGGAGFIGSHLTERLLACGHSVCVLDNFDDYYDPALKMRNLEQAQQYDNFSLVVGDIRDVALLKRVFGSYGFDAVVHLAALAGVRYSLNAPEAFNDVNVTGTIRLLEAARAAGKPKVVIASTSSAYGNSPHIPYREDDPLLHCVSPYGATKIACEKYGYIYHAVHGMDTVLLRFFTAYGPRQRPDMAIHKFVRAVLRGEPLTVFGDGSTSRDYAYIGDIVNGVVAAIEQPVKHDIINLGNNVATPLSELIAAIEDATGCTAVIERLTEQPGDPPHTCADITRARAVLGYEPTTQLKDGLAAFVAWYMEHMSDG
jgi:UDP-glucuronate 4-epimerase